MFSVADHIRIQYKRINMRSVRGIGMDNDTNRFSAQLSLSGV